MPFGIYTDFKCPKFHKNKFTPQAHQQFVKDFFVNSPYKGMLLFHKLGSGKTCSSIFVSDILLEMKQIQKVFVFTPGSLRQGWINEYCGVCGKDPELLKKYTFVTYNYGVGSKLLKENMDNSLIIIDEVHNFINGIKNESKTAMEIYKNILRAENSKILALSGTPIYNNIYEWTILGNMLKPGFFPTDKTQFLDLFKKSNDGTLTPYRPEAFKNALKGIVSFYKGASELDYPKVIEEPIVKVKMHEFQEASYWSYQDSEDTILRFGFPKLHLKFSNLEKNNKQKLAYTIAVKHILTRKASNCYYPPNVADKKDLLEPNGWISRKQFGFHALEEIYSPKIAAVYKNILDNFNSKHMVFTFFKEKSGVYLMDSLLKMCGVKTAVFSGDLSDKKREKLLKEYNSIDNINGQKIKVLFLTDAGVEGISLLETGHVHILESDRRENKIQQAIGRAVRYKSHSRMKPEDRIVHIWRYWSVSKYPKGTAQQLTFETASKETDGKEILFKTVNTIIRDTIDQKLYEQGQIQMNEITSFLNLLIENSIENGNT